ncbi:hypothetical protein [Maribacter polysiphoniae]|uniref:hypothetical protein n=1 Tax=Maribacter polysiphoniae TaxID=429344 RepID=UPI0023567AE2|nr:hypothetical protein [Maribacter polysiphoniae]
MSEYMERKVKSKVEKYFRALLKIVIGGILLIAFIMLFGYITMRLWNWLMPEIFGLVTIDYWQAIGIIVLSKIIFGGFGSHNSAKSRKKKIRNKLSSKCTNGGNKDFSKWKYYDQFWEEAGNQAFEDFVKHKKEGAGPQNEAEMGS